MSLGDIYSLRSRFQRSARLDTDLRGGDALDGYVLNPTAWQTLERIANIVASSRQRAFTWTGAYGSGKSSLGLLLSALLSDDTPARRKAREIVGAERLRQIRSIVPENHTGWLVVRVVATIDDPEQALRESVRAAAIERWGRRLPAAIADGDLVQSVSAVANKIRETPRCGVLLIVDELGRMLEFASKRSGKIHFLQDLAELFCRLEPKSLLIGILHQAFQEYAANLGPSAGDEWAKVQGRFSDIPISADLLESLDLIAEAISGPRRGNEVAEQIDHVADAVSASLGLQSAAMERKLRACWPLHPLTALLLGPVSRRKFGQNARTIFSILCSGEPSGFRTFLREHDRPGVGYEVADLWDYLQFNLEPAILASADGHRWAEAAEAIDRTKRQGSPLHIRLAKTISIVDLFGRGSQLKASTEILRACFWDVEEEAISAALADLRGWSVAIYREHIFSWAIFSGSDLDLSTLLSDAIGRLEPQTVMQRSLSAVDSPVVAKRHYVRTGTLRWFASRVAESATVEAKAMKRALSRGCDGVFALVLPKPDENLDDLIDKCRAFSKRFLSEGRPVAVGLPQETERLGKLALEIAGYQEIKRENPTLDGDAVARRELSAREAMARERFETAAREAFTEAMWFVDGKMSHPSKVNSITQLASILADKAFPATPILRNELVNRERPSSNAAAARRSLMHRMVRDSSLPNLGIEGNPPEKSMYLSVLRGPGFHGPRDREANWGFRQPDQNGVGETCTQVWTALTEFLDGALNAARTISEMYDLCRSTPFGLRQGIIPILVLAFFLAQEDKIALYLDGVFLAGIDEFFVDRLLQDPNCVSVRKFELAGVSRSALNDIARLFDGARQRSLDQLSPLAVARPLVAFVRGLNPWVKRTRRLSPTTAAVRDAILRADDPYGLLFEALPTACGLEKIKQGREGAENSSLVVEGLGMAVRELRNVYKEMLLDLRRTVATALGCTDLTPLDEAERLATRSTRILGKTGDFRLEAFAQRLATATTEPDWVEGIASLAINKPSRDWTDPDLDRARLEILELANRWRRVEKLIGQRERTGVSFSLLYQDHSETLEFEETVQTQPELDIRVRALTDHLKEVVERESLPAEALVFAVAQALKDLKHQDAPAETNGRAALPLSRAEEEGRS